MLALNANSGDLVLIGEAVCVWEKQLAREALVMSSGEKSNKVRAFGAKC